MKSNYRSSSLKELCDQQVRFAPREKKVEQVGRAERLLAEIDPQKDYTYEYLCFRITDYRPDAKASGPIPGSHVRHDLLRFVEDVSDAANLRVEDVPEVVHTVEELSKLFKVSPKTISRWREQGLVGRRFLFGRRKRMGFLRSSVDQFVRGNSDRIKRGERFSLLTDEERDEIIDRARRLANAGGCPTEVVRRVAQQMHRSPETVRYTLRHFDVKHPHLAVFPDHGGPLSDEAKERIYQQHRRGMTIDELARAYRRTPSSVYRIISARRAQQIMQLPLEYIPNPSFGRATADITILGLEPAPEVDGPKVSRPPSGLPPYLAALYDTPLLSAEDERFLFRKYNYLKYKAAKLRRSLNPAAPKSPTMDEIESLYEQAVEVKNKLVKANLRLVVSIAKRHVTSADDLFALISDGNVSLLRAVEKFDYARGNKFSTYASWAIMMNFARSIPDELKQRDRFRTSTDEVFTQQSDERANHVEQEAAQKTREEQIGRILKHLDDREQKIIISRFGLDYHQEPLTLQEVGEEMGVTKERVRQIEARAISKLRLAAQTENVELPE